jgi:hypothetical protein
MLLYACLLLLAQTEDLADEVKDLNWIGFQQFQEVSRVFVRTTEPAKHTVDGSGKNVVVLTLQNTRIPRYVNTLPLETRYFDGPVLRVVPKVEEGPSSTVRIEIYLSDAVPFEKVQTDTYLALDFERL